MSIPVAYALRSGPYLLDEHAGVMIDSSGNYSAKTRGNALALVVLLRAIADDIEDDVELGLKPEPVTVQHERYDPMCSEYRPPRGPDSQYLHDFNRGKKCPICVAETPAIEHDPRCISLTKSEFNSHCDCETFRLIDQGAREETYSVYGGQGLMRIASGLSRADAERVSRKFEIDCMNAGLTNPPGRIEKDR